MSSVNIIPSHSLKCTFSSREDALQAFRDEIRWRLSTALITNQTTVEIHTPFIETLDWDFIPGYANINMISEDQVNIVPGPCGTYCGRGDIHNADSASARDAILQRYYNNQHFLNTGRFVIVNVLPSR